VLYYLFDINDLDKPKIENFIYFIRNKSIGFMIWTTPPIGLEAHQLEGMEPDPDNKIHKYYQMIFWNIAE